jgi:fused signal recognition particle receptor
MHLWRRLSGEQPAPPDEAPGADIDAGEPADDAAEPVALDEATWDAELESEALAAAETEMSGPGAVPFAPVPAASFSLFGSGSPGHREPQAAAPPPAAPAAERPAAEPPPAPTAASPAEPDTPRAEPPAPAASSAAWTAGGTASFTPQQIVGEGPPGDLAEGLQRSRSGFMGRLRLILQADDPAGPSWDDVEETLIAGDVGGALSMEVVERARQRHDPEGPEAAVRAELAAILPHTDPSWRPAPAAPGAPAILLVVGVNGTGKTTTIGKLAARYGLEGDRVVLAAGDTFRAAAIDQLRIWAERSGADIVAHGPGADPGAVVYDALDAAAARHADVVIADTAGRLHTKSNLMDELAKIRRIIDKRFPGAVPEVFFVLDATTGQNGLAQARSFHETVGITGIILTKLDSTAKGGIVFAIEDALNVPVRYVGVGERVGDLLPFDPDEFVAALFA